MKASITSEVTAGFGHAVSPLFIPAMNGSVLPWFSPSVTSWGTTVTPTIALSQGIITLPQGTSIPGDPSVVLQHALHVEIENTRDGVVLRSASLDEEAFGASYNEACLDFLTSLRDRYRSLSRREERLSPQDCSVLERLCRLLEPSQGS